MSVMTRAERIDLEEELVALQAFHPDVRAVAQEMLRELVNDPAPDKDKYDQKLQKIYEEGHQKRVKVCFFQR